MEQKSHRSNSMAGDHLGVIEVVKDFIEKIEKGQELSDICMISAKPEYHFY